MTSRSMLIAACWYLALLPGCQAGLSDDELVTNAESVLASAHLSCSVSVSSKGVGEGDSSNAYALLRLGVAEGERERQEEVEVLLSNVGSGTWKIQRAGENELVAKARKLCRD